MASVQSVDDRFLFVSSSMFVMALLAVALWDGLALEASGEKRLTTSADVINARKVGEQELRALDPELSSFFNVNTPEDYQRALKLAGFGK